MDACSLMKKDFPGKVKGTSRRDAPIRVWVRDDTGGCYGSVVVAYFNDMSFAEGCRDAINEIDPRFEADVVKVDLEKWES